MQDGASMIPGNRYTYAIFIEMMVLFIASGEREMFSLSIGALHKILEKHCKG